MYMKGINSTNAATKTLSTFIRSKWTIFDTSDNCMKIREQLTCIIIAGFIVMEKKFA